MEYTRQPKTGIQRFLEQAAANNNPNPPQLLMSGHVMNAPRGLESVGRGIAKLLAAPEQEKQAMVYGTAQQQNLASGNLEQAAADAAQSGDMDSAIKLAQVAENAKYRGAMLNKDAENIARAEKKEYMKQNGGTLNTINAIDGLMKNADSIMSQYDKEFKSEEDYKKQTGIGRFISKTRRNNLSADEEELAARNKFAADRDQSVILLRQQMQGQGQITDYETRLLDRASKASNPYEFKTILGQIKQGLANKVQPMDGEYAPQQGGASDYSKYGY